MASDIVKSNAIAVIGHSSIETSDAAGEIYDREGIPVINVVPVTEHLTEEHPYHFNITYTAESEAAYLANYLAKLDDKVTAGIIHTGDPADLEAQKQFRNQFVELGGVVTFRQEITLPEPVLVEQSVTEGDITEIVVSEAPFQISAVEARLLRLWCVRWSIRTAASSSFAGAPTMSERSAKTLPSVTTAPAPTRQSLPITALLSTTAWIPISAPSPTVQP
jgi:hypothetical protein